MVQEKEIYKIYGDPGQIIMKNITNLSMTGNIMKNG